MDRNHAPQVLLAVAEAAQDVAAGLNKFLSHVSDHDVDITALISKCFSISSALRSLATAVEQPRRLSHYDRVSDDIQDVAQSLDHTFKDVHQIVGEGFESARRAKISVTTAYRRVWRDVNGHFLNESGNTLLRRLEYCRLLVVDLCDILQQGSPHNEASFDDLAHRVSKLLDVQLARLRQGIGGPEADIPTSPGSSSKKQPSFERQRPDIEETMKSGQGKRPALEKRQSANSSNRDRRKRAPPPAPEVPRSASSSSSEDDESDTSSESCEEGPTHWLPKVFERIPSSTKLSETGEPSICLGEDNPNATKFLREEYENLIKIPFESGDLQVSLHLRLRDGQARMLCETLRPVRHAKDCTIYLTNLDIERDRQFLKFFRINSSKRKPILWAVLRFTSYETLVLFHCTFLALRSQDNGRPIHKAEDWKLREEQEVFKCEIQDDQFIHCLKLLHDRDSGGVRMQASVAKGDLKRMPVWTAFVTHQIHSPIWMRRASSKTLLLADLHRYVFDNEYNPPIASSGEHDLTFKHAEDADEFWDAVEDLAENA